MAVGNILWPENKNPNSKSVLNYCPTKKCPVLYIIFADLINLHCKMHSHGLMRRHVCPYIFNIELIYNEIKKTRHNVSISAIYIYLNILIYYFERLNFNF